MQCRRFLKTANQFGEIQKCACKFGSKESTGFNVCVNKTGEAFRQHRKLNNESLSQLAEPCTTMGITRSG